VRRLTPSLFPPTRWRCGSRSRPRSWRRAPPEFKGVEFTGVVTPERSRAHKAWVNNQEMARAEVKIRSLHRDSFYLSLESMHVDSWWMNTAGTV
jgi:hypothetical protein